MVKPHDLSPLRVVIVLQYATRHASEAVRLCDQNFQSLPVDVVLTPRDVQIIVRKKIANNHALSPAIFFRAEPNFG